MIRCWPIYHAARAIKRSIKHAHHTRHTRRAARPGIVKSVTAHKAAVTLVCVVVGGSAAILSPVFFSPSTEATATPSRKVATNTDSPWGSFERTALRDGQPFTDFLSPLPVSPLPGGGDLSGVGLPAAESRWTSLPGRDRHPYQVPEPASLMLLATAIAAMMAIWKVR